MDSEGAFDVIVIGTGLTESIIAAALSKAGFKVAHLDTNQYYGADEASLSLDEYIDWADNHSNSSQFSSFSSLSSSDVLPNYRQYSITLCPSVIPATGSLISSLVSSGVSRYGGFRLVEQIAVYSSSSPNKVKTVPGSKEDIFKDKTISLVDKRRLMRFLVFASGDFEERPELDGNPERPFIEFLKRSFSLNQEMAETIAYALSHCSLPSDQTGPALQRLRRYLRSAGRYGASPFLIGHYGSSGEIAQGFCRTAAVAGGVYILGKTISSITRNPDSSASTYTVTLSDFPESITCDLLISPQSRLPETLAEPEVLGAEKVSSAFPSPLAESSPASIARCICIIDKPLSFATKMESSAETEVGDVEGAPALDTGILVFPPSSLSEGSSTSSVTALIVGEGTMSVPKGKWMIYLSAPIPPSSEASISPETLLKPYLDATLSLSSLPITTADPLPSTSIPVIPLFTSFYLQSPSSSLSSSDPASITSPTTPPTQSAQAISQPSILLTPPQSILPLPDWGDAAAVNAEAVFWKAVKALQAFKANNGKGRKDSNVHPSEISQGEGRPDADASEENENLDSEGTEVKVESFWPPIGNDNGDEDSDG